MTRDLNRVMLIGRLGTDTETRYTAAGKMVTSFRMAVNRRSRPSDTGEQRDETDWFTVTAWERLAETCDKYLRKGSRVYIEGRLQTRSWEDQNGQRRTATDIVASDMILLDSRRTAESGDAAEVGSAGSDETDIDEIPF